MTYDLVRIDLHLYAYPRGTAPAHSHLLIQISEQVYQACFEPKHSGGPAGFTSLVTQALRAQAIKSDG